MAKVDRRIKGRRKPINKKQRKKLSEALKGNKNAVGAASGRPAIEYTEKIGKKVRDMLMAMFPITKIAEIIGVHRDTLYKWKGEIVEFSDMWEYGVNGVDHEIVRSLQKRAAGFKKRVEKPIKIKNMQGNDEIINHVYTEYHPPDTRAIEIWLKNRSNVKKQWSNLPDEDAPPPTITVNNNQIDISKLDDETIRKLIGAAKP